MKLDKAIELLKTELTLGKYPLDHDLGNAIKLGIEALKRVGEDKTKYYYPKDFDLPGETAE